MADKIKEQSFAWVDDFRREQLKKSTRNPGLAAMLSFFVMGMGQIYAGHIDRGIIYFVVNIFSLFSGYSIYKGGILYESLVSLLGPNGLVALCYVVCVLYILLWIYNVKDAYYLAIFSCFRDWFEVERVLLPSMGVPKELLLSTANENNPILIEDKRICKNANSSCNVDEVGLKEEKNSMEDIEDNDIINVTASIDSTSVDYKQEEILDKKVEQISESTTAELVYMNYSYWRLLGSVCIVVVFAVIGIYYINNDDQRDSAIQIAKDYQFKKENETIVASEVSNNKTLISSASYNISNGSSFLSPEKSYPILMTQSQIEAYVDWRMKDMLASREKTKSQYNNIALYSEENGESIPLIVSSDIIDDNELNNESSSDTNSVVFIQGHKEAKVLKKTSGEDEEVIRNSKVLYLASDTSEDVELVLADENGSVEIQQPVLDKKLKVPSVDKIVLDQLRHDKSTFANQKIEVAEDVINEENTSLSKNNNSKNNKKMVSTYQETPENKIALEKIKERGAYEFYRGNWEAALPFYFELLKYRRNAESFEMVGIIFEKMDKTQDAYDAYKNAYDLGLTSRNNITRLGILGEKLGKYEDAQKFLEKAIEMSPKRADIVLSYARCLDKLGESLAAAQVLAVLRDSTPSYAIKKAAEQEYLRISKEHDYGELEQKKVEEAVTSAIRKKR